MWKMLIVHKREPRNSCYALGKKDFYMVIVNAIPAMKLIVLQIDPLVQ